MEIARREGEDCIEHISARVHRRLRWLRLALPYCVTQWGAASRRVAGHKEVKSVDVLGEPWYIYLCRVSLALQSRIPVW